MDGWMGAPTPAAAPSVCLFSLLPSLASFISFVLVLVPAVRWFADRPATDPTDDVACDPDLTPTRWATEKLKIKKKACKESSLNLQRA
jgi:hypothetical protein